MKVLQINSVCGIRSTGRIATNIAEEYLVNGHQCRIAYGREYVPQKYRSISYRIGSNFSVRVNALKARLFDNEGFNAKRATKKFLKWADNYNPDILWIHNLHGYYINIELLFNWIKSRPQMQVRWTLHDCWAFTGHCAHFSFVRCEHWKETCMNCRQKGQYPKSFWKDASRKNYQCKKELFCGVPDMTIITPSVWLANLVKQSFLKEYQIEVVHNTIDQTVFCPRSGEFRQRMNLVHKKIVLGVATAWGEKKGLNDFIRLEQLLDDSYVVVLIGVNKKQMKTIPKSIICLPRTNSLQELAEIYTAADVFVNLTYEDTYPTVNLEAQACGTPCLTYCTGGSVESVPYENVVAQGDLRSMLQKIQIICQKGLL